MSWTSFRRWRKEKKLGPNSGHPDTRVANEFHPADPAVPYDTKASSQSALHPQSEASLVIHQGGRNPSGIPELRVIARDDEQTLSNKRISDSVTTAPSKSPGVSHSIHSSPPPFHPSPEATGSSLSRPVPDTHVVLEQLAEHIIPGAEIDSTSRYPPPRCHPGTRLRILEELMNRILNPEKRILWLKGPAGVGKSAILQTVAEFQAGRGALGTGLFFSKRNGRNDLSLVWTSISYQLAVRLPSYRAFIQDQLATDPKFFDSFFDSCMREQFKRLIAKPFSQAELTSAFQSLPIFLDGLDECEGVQAQIEVIDTIAEFVKEFPMSPLVWIVASRPEHHLKFAFEHSYFKNEVYGIEIPVGSDQSHADVERYLRDAFQEMHQLYRNYIPETSSWPTERDFLVLANTSSGLFALASAIVRFIGDHDVADPVSQLSRVLSIATKGCDPHDISQFLTTGMFPKDI